MAGFDLSDYVDARTRIQIFWQTYPNGSIVTTRPELMPGRDDMIYMVAKVYADREQYQLIATGTAAELTHGKTSYTKDSELMNLETSAISRAIGAAGIGISKSVASLNEVVRQQEMEAQPKTAPKKPVKASESVSEPELDPWGQPVVYEPENEDVPTCKHGVMEFKSGVGKTGKAYSGYVCTAPREEQCPAQWN